MCCSFLFAQLDALTDECLDAKVTVGEVKKEKTKILKAQKQKDNEARSAANVSSVDGAVDIFDDDFAIGEVQEMSFGSGSSSSIVTNNGKSNKQALVDIFARYDRNNTGSMDPTTFKRMCIDLLTEAEFVSEEEVRKFNDANDVNVVIAALDMDGDGAVQQDEFISWILSGFERSKADRRRFAQKNQLNARLEMFLGAVEEFVNKTR